MTEYINKSVELSLNIDLKANENTDGKESLQFAKRGIQQIREESFDDSSQDQTAEE